MKTFIQPTAAAALLLLVGCANVAVEDSNFKEVESNLSEAQEVNAQRVAGNEYVLANTKLKAAREANEEGDRDKTLRLLAEARVHAKLAEVRAISEASKESVRQINESLDAFEQELKR